MSLTPQLACRTSIPKQKLPVVYFDVEKSGNPRYVIMYLPDVCILAAPNQTIDQIRHELPGEDFKDSVFGIGNRQYLAAMHEIVEHHAILPSNTIVGVRAGMTPYGVAVVAYIPIGGSVFVMCEQIASLIYDEPVIAKVRPIAPRPISLTSRRDHREWLRRSHDF